MAKQAFSTVLKGMKGMETAAIEVPFDVKKVFGTKARVPVVVTIDGHRFRSSIMPMGGCHKMVVNKQMRETIGKRAGDQVDVVMEQDMAKRTITIPPKFKSALANAHLLDIFKGLSFTHQKEFVVWILSAKKEETKERRLAQAIDLIKRGKSSYS